MSNSGAVDASRPAGRTREFPIPGRIGAQLVSVEHPASRWKAAPADVLALAQLTSAPVAATLELGEGPFWTSIPTGGVLVMPPNHESHAGVEGAHRLRVLNIPYPSLRAFAQDPALPVDGRFGALHRQVLTDSELEGLFRRRWAEAEAGHPSGALFADGLVLQAMGVLLRRRQALDRPARGGLPRHLLRRVVDFVEANLTSDLHLAALADLTDLTPWHFCRVFKETTGTTPVAYVQRRRIERAMELLRATELPILEVASEVGYDSPAHFARLFRRETGTTPREWRRNDRERCSVEAES